MNSSISLAGAIALVEAQAVKMVGALYALRFGWKSSSSTATAENHATIDADGFQLYCSAKDPQDYSRVFARAYQKLVDPAQTATTTAARRY
jgi:hypothetical protein